MATTALVACARILLLTALALPTLVLPAGADQRTVFSVRGTIKVVEGEQCGVYEGRDAGCGKFLGFFPKVCFDRTGIPPYLVDLGGEWRLPRWADQATVILNGFRATYLSTDHHVKQIKAGISEVHREGRRLGWHAGVSLLDKNHDDPVHACYHYTIVAWNSRRIDARVLDEEALQESGNSDLGGIRRIVSATVDRDAARLAILPAGFDLFLDGDDHHLYQLAYALGQDADAADVGSERRWDAWGVLKDNKKRAFSFDSGARVIGGSGVRVISEPFQIPPKRNCGGFGTGCIGETGAHRRRLTEEFRVTNPGAGFDYVIPMLTGFDLSFKDDDEHVKRVGAWLHGIAFDPATRTLDYSVSTELFDKNDSPGFLSRTNVVLLCLSRKPKYDILNPHPRPTPGCRFPPCIAYPGR